MTARVTTLKGPDAGAYYVDGPAGTTSTATSRPAGGSAWRRRARPRRGVDDDDFLSLMDGLDPTTSELLGTSHHERTVRVRRHLLGTEVGVGPVRHR